MFCLQGVLFRPKYTHDGINTCFVYREFSFGKNIRMSVESDGCAGTENEVNYLEHVQAYVTLRSSYRGCVTIYLTSPMNTT